MADTRSVADLVDRADLVTDPDDLASELYSLPCPTCGAEPFTYCRSAAERRTRPHMPRRELMAPSEFELL